MTATEFIQRWNKATGSELANAQLFITELCELLELPRPDPATGAAEQDAYVFERRAQHLHGDGSENERRIDCYRRGCFILEAKKIKAGVQTKGFDDARLRARNQAEQYARDIPANEGRPPFVLVVDVGHFIELYSEFSQSGATYVPFPDPRSHRITLADLNKAELRERLRAVWLDPASLNPARQSAKVTREVADALAKVAKALEGSGHTPQLVAEFLTRCLFTFFAEDVRLLPKRAFTTLLEEMAQAPAQFVPMIGELWQRMDQGGFSVAVRTEVLRFNGKLFKSPTVLPLSTEQIGLLLDAARKDWSQVEPAIIGTLLERALDPRVRHALGAHYTPRAYVERLVLPTVIEPLREDWALAQAAALTLVREGKSKEAIAELRRFHHRLCTVRVLDPACGSGNFLYVTLEHLKRLEGEVLAQLDELGASQTSLALGREHSSETETVDPHQFLGLEINPRAAALAELVLWLGYLQWHFRTRGSDTTPPLPVLKDFRTIECRDAVLAYDGVEFVTDERGVPVTRWDGRTFKKHPVTGEDVPDETARIPLERYQNPRKAEWPAADFVVGNPPYLGARTIRLALGDGYLEALRSAYSNVPDHADFVMYWWWKAGTLVNAGQLRRFGLITTKSIQQEFSRKVVAELMEPPSSLRLAFAVPNHPWVDSSDGAAVRVGLTVAGAGIRQGALATVAAELPGADGEIEVRLVSKVGTLTPSLTLDQDLHASSALKANSGLSCVGYQLTGKGFVLTADDAKRLAADAGAATSLIRPLLTGRDITQTNRGLLAIDLFGLDQQSLQTTYPHLFQHVFDRVHPERMQNNRQSLRDRWWVFGEARSTFRPALKNTSRVLVTSLTSKHRFFVFTDAQTIADSTTVICALGSAEWLAVLSSRVHVLWAVSAGGRLGVGDDPRYNKGVCFETFPFPTLDADQATSLGKLAEAIDAHRKRQQAAHPDLTLTGMYNVLEALRQQRPLTDKEKRIHEQGLVSVLASLHDDLDRAVLAAYGWGDLAPALVGKPGGTTPFAEPDPAQAAAQAELLSRLVALNAERAAEEARGLIRWLRPDYQNPQAAERAPQQQLEAEVEPDAEEATSTVTAAPLKRLPWPAELPAQVRAVAEVLSASRQPLDLDAIAAHFTGKGPWKKRLPQLLDTLEALGRVRPQAGGYAAG